MIIVILNILGIVVIYLVSKGILIFVYCCIYEHHEKIVKGRKKSEHSNNEVNKEGFLHSFLRILFFSYGYSWIRFQLIKVGHIPSNRVRNLIYRFIFRAKISKKTVINGGVEIRNPWNLHAGNCIVMNGCILDARAEIYIGENVVFGTGVHIWTEEHDVNDPEFRVLDTSRGSVTIEDRCWICSDSSILPGISIAEGCVIASKALVTKSTEPYGIYVGIPAVRKSERNRSLKYELSGKPHLHFY